MWRKCLVLTTVLVLAVSTVSFAGTQTYNESWQLRTSPAANDLHREFRVTKNVTVKSQESVTFPTKSYSRSYYNENYDTVRFDYSGAEVVVGQYAYTCVAFNTPDDESWAIAYQNECTWTAGGNDLSQSIPGSIPSMNIAWSSENPAVFDVVGAFTHEQVDPDENPIGDIRIEDAQWALSETEIPIENMTWDDTTGLSWSDLEDPAGESLAGGFTLTHGGSQEFLIANQLWSLSAEHPATVVLRYHPYMDGETLDTGQWGMAQLTIGTPPGIPAVSAWGLAVMALLVVAGATIIIMRRRRAMTAH